MSRRDRGSILILGAGVTAVVLALLLVVVAVVGVALRQHDADLAADAAARAAAQAVDLGRYYAGDPDRRVPLDPEQARLRAAHFLALTGGWRLSEVTVSRDVVSVSVVGEVRVPGAGWWSGRTVTVRGSGAAELRRG